MDRMQKNWRRVRGETELNQVDNRASRAHEGSMALLFDDTKKLEKALGEEAAGVIIGILEKQDEAAKRDLATKADLERGLRELELRLEYRLTLRLGAITVSAIAVMAALMKFLA